MQIFDTVVKAKTYFTPTLLCSFLILTIAPFTYGFDNQGFATVLSMDGFAESFGDFEPKTQEYYIPSYFLSLLNSLQYIGFAIGLFVGSMISARWGRRMCIFVECIYSWFPVIIILTAKSKPQILIGRILNYAYVGMELAVIPVYQSEIAPKELRGVFVGTYQFALTVGGVVINAICNGTGRLPGRQAWMIPIGLYFILPTFIASCIWFIPESPRWLLTRGENEKAQNELTRLRKGKFSPEDIESEFLEIRLQIENEPEQGQYSELFRGVNLKRTLIAVGMNFFIQATGQAFGSQYGAIFIKSLGVDPFKLTIANSAVSAVCCLINLLISDKLGRKPLLLFSATVMMIALFVMGGVGTKSPIDGFSMSDKYTIVGMFFMLGGGFSLGWAPLTYVVTTEIPALRLRDKTQRVASFVNILMNFIVNFTLPYLLDKPYANLKSKVGFIYGSLAFMSIIFTIFCVPECKGKTLEEVDYLFHQKVPMSKFGNAKMEEKSNTAVTAVEVSS